jgi:hypothetical protein
MVLSSANAISYICGREYPGCHCRSSTALNNGGQIGEGDLDVATVVAAMQIAEQDEAPMHYEPWMMIMRPIEEQLQQRQQQSQPPRAQPATRTQPTRTARPATPMPATTATGRTVRGRTATGRTVTGRTVTGRTVRATTAPVRHAQPRRAVLPNQVAQTQGWPASRASAQSQSSRAVLVRHRRPARPTLSGMPVTPVRSAI